jgi:hypoxanthine phosphoribosyltransferase
MTKLLIAPQAIEDAVIDLSDLINAKYHNAPPPVLSPILQGGVTFFNDVARFLLIDAYVDYIGISSYSGMLQGDFDLYKAWNTDLIDKDVWLIDDIADTGNTMKYLEDLAYSEGAKHVYKVALLRRKSCLIELDFHGFSLDKEWVFGYGMDGPDGLGRLSDSIYTV